MYQYRSIAEAIKSISRTEGLKGFFYGYGTTALRDAPYAGFYVLFFEQCKRVYGGKHGYLRVGKMRK